MIQVRIRPIMIPKGMGGGLALEMAARDVRAVMGMGRTLVVLGHTFTVSHEDGAIDLGTVFPNPFSPKQWGNTKSLGLYRQYILENPSIMFDIAVFCGAGNALFKCGCKHKRCHAEVLVEMARYIHLGGAYRRAPHVVTTQMNGMRKIQVFGIRGSTAHIQRDDPVAMSTIEESKVFGDWEYTCITVFDMFQHLFDVGDSNASLLLSN